MKQRIPSPGCGAAAMRSRDGAALIIAIVVLAAMLMLGLPFLFTQSASLSGTRSFAHSQSAYIGRDAAENLGIAAGSLAVKTNFKGTTGATGTEQWTNLEQTLEKVLPPGAAVNLGDNRTGLDLARLPQRYNATVQNASLIGTVIEDEAGKVDPNSLTVAGWDALFKKIGIPDWDDNQVVCSKAAYNPSTMQYNQANDDDNYGELARAMAELRLKLPGRRIVRIEQLLQADTGHWNGVQGGYSYPNSSPPPQRFGLRRPLTRAELELLRPFLTLHNPSQGRGSADPSQPPPAFGLGKEGIIDLGSVVLADPPSWANGYQWLYNLDSTAVNSFDQAAPMMLAKGQPILVGMGTWVVSDKVDKIGPQRGIVWSYGQGLRIQANSDSTNYQAALYTTPAAPNSPTYRGANSVPLAIEAPPVMNINAANLQIRAIFGDLPKPGTLPVQTQAALKDLSSQLKMLTFSLLGFNLQNPLGSTYLTTNANDKRLVELPPLGIASTGVISIASAAAVTDPQGRQNAQEIRRAVVQAIPQEQVVEKRWITQGHMHALIAQRYGSQVEAWPNPYRRLLQDAGNAKTLPDDPDLSGGGGGGGGGGRPADLTGIRPAAQPNYATGFANRTDEVIKRTGGNWGANPPTTAQGKPAFFLQDGRLTIDWRMPIGGDVATDPSEMFKEKERDVQAAVVGNASYTIDDLRPDGLLLNKSPLAVELTDDQSAEHGLLRRTNFTIKLGNQALRGWEINGRHLGFWITPQSDWSSGIVPLLETRIPIDHAAGQITTGGMAAANGNSDLQNYLGLFYDRSKQMLVLVFAPPAIEHLTDYGMNIPWDDTTTTFDLDERCLGSDASGNLKALAPAQVKDADPSGHSPRLESVTSLFRPNRIVHCFKVPDRNGKPYFHQGQSVNIELALANDRPGGSAIIVDGCAGSDVAHDTSNPNGTLTKFGDHCALPGFPLASDVPYTDITSAFGGGLQLATITVRPVAGLNAEDCFPVRGMLRIDDEYFTYESVSGNTFNKCVRGQRENSVTFGAVPQQRWPVTELHTAGSMVTPGGYRLTVGYPSWKDGSGAGPTRHLYTGNCTLAQELPNGDPDMASGPMQWHVWAKVDSTKIPPLLTDPTDPSGSTVILFPNAPTPTDIPLSTMAGMGVPSQFPPRGVIWINGQKLAYSSKSGNSLSGITDVTGWNFIPGLAPPAAPITSIRFNKNNPPTIFLVSMEVNGTDPTQPGRFSQDPGNNGAFLFQVMHASTGRVEWISYNYLASSGQGNYFIHLDDGFSYNNRGQQRTDFVGRVKIDPVNMHTTLTPTTTFPAGSLVLPVQTDLTPAGHFLATGDVITLLPKGQLTGSGLGKPIQLVVRYASMDGYDMTDSKRAIFDTKNEYFAFNDPLPDIFTNQDAEQFEFLSWPGWSGKDIGALSPLGPDASPHSYLPRIDDFAAGYAPGGAAARTFLAAADNERNGVQAGVTAVADAVIDGVTAGPLPSSDASTLGAISQWLTTNGQPLANGIDASVTAMAGAKVQTVENVFVVPMGLIMIGGEVFAFDRDSNPTGQKDNEAMLVGRALLGSTAATHAGHEPFTILPIGPVARIDGSMPDQDWFHLYDKDQKGQNPARRWVRFDAPAALICDPAGTPAGGGQPNVEIVQLIGPRIETDPAYQTNKPKYFWYSTAPWLRGLYNTVQKTWGPSAGGLAPIVIGWWPRYASALPKNNLIPQHFRSRTYSWVGFPLAMDSARFDQTLFASDPISTVSVLDTKTSDVFTIQARAMATGFDWTLVPAVTLDNSAKADQDATAAFNSSQFTNKAVNGAELRVYWQYSADPSSKFDDIATAGNCAPTIGPVRLRALAPAKVLSVESAR